MNFPIQFSSINIHRFKSLIFKIGEEKGRVHRLQLGGYSVDEEPHSFGQDGKFPRVEYMRG